MQNFYPASRRFNLISSIFCFRFTDTIGKKSLKSRDIFIFFFTKHVDLRQSFRQTGGGNFDRMPLLAGSMTRLCRSPNDDLCTHCKHLSVPPNLVILPGSCQRRFLDSTPKQHFDCHSTRQKWVQLRYMTRKQLHATCRRPRAHLIDSGPGASVISLSPLPPNSSLFFFRHATRIPLNRPLQYEADEGELKIFNAIIPDEQVWASKTDGGAVQAGIHLNNFAAGVTPQPSAKEKAEDASALTKS